MVEIGLRSFSWASSSWAMYENETSNRAWFFYPTSSSAPSTGSDSQTPWVLPRMVMNGAMDGERLPLVVLSHGWGGDCTEQAWLAAALVERKFAVLSLDHFDSWTHGVAPDGRLLHPLELDQRVDEVLDAVDSLFSEPTVESKLCRDRIGVSGFSVGGTTALMAEGRLRERFGRSALFLMAPRADVFTVERLASVTSPVSIVAGLGDEVLPWEENAGVVASSVTGATATWLEKPTGHFVFLNQATDFGRQILPEHLHQDAPDVDRKAIHERVRQVAVDFFEKTLCQP